MRNKTPNSLATEPVGTLLWRYAIPAITGTMVMSLYNVIDRIFIGQGVGADAISGLALTFPIMSLGAAIGMLVGAGAAARISIVLGKHDRKTAEQILGNSLLLTFIFAAIYITLFLVFLDKILYEFGGSANTIPYAREYLRIIIPGMILTNLCFGFNNMMRASGYPNKAMYTMLIGAVCNVILDPIFIFGLEMGIRGAAVATNISMFISMVFVMIHFFNPKSYIHFCRDSFRLSWNIIGKIISIGLSPFLINVTASAVNVIMNTSLQRHGGDIAIGAYGVVNSIAMLVVMLIIGLCQGMQPIVGYNFGAKLYPRMKRAYILTVIVATVITTTGFLSTLIFPKLIARIFTQDTALIEESAHALRLVLFAFPLVGFQIVTTNLFQSIGMAGKSIFLSLSRQVLFLIPLILFFPRIWGVNGVWLASPYSDVISTIVTLLMILWQWRFFKTSYTKTVV